MYALRNRSSDNAQIAHIWAQQTGEKGQAKGGNVFFEGRTIYSYGYHFPMAVFIKDNAVIINNDSYSNTTSTHQSYVRQALPDSCKRYYANTAILKIFIQDNIDKKRLKTALTEYLDSNLEDTLKDCSKPRIKQTTKAKHITEFTTLFTRIQEIAALFKVKLPVKFSQAIDTLINDLGSAIAKYEKTVKAAKVKKEKACAKYNAEQKALAAEAIKLWLNNEHLDYKMQRAMEHNAGITYLRLNKDEIETTRGARFPIKEAIEAFPTIASTVTLDTFLTCNIQLGSFHITKIDHGNVTAGCHFVEWPQIKRIAEQLNLL